MQNTIQNAGHRRSSSAARRALASQKRSSTAGASDDDPNKMHSLWDETNPYLIEQEKGEPKTPYQYGCGAVEDDEDVAINPRFVNVDEVDLAKNKSLKKARESEISGLDIGEPEQEFAHETGQGN
jgi:protein phosphatase inhibitor 2